MPDRIDYQVFHPPNAPPTSDSKPIKFGILGAAAIAPIALVIAAINHPEVVVCAIAARDKKRAEAFARKYKILKAYGGSGGYQGAQTVIKSRSLLTSLRRFFSFPFRRIVG